MFIHFQFVSRVARGEDVTRPRDSYKTWTPLSVDDLKAMYGVCLLLEMVLKDRLATASYLHCPAYPKYSQAIATTPLL